MTNTELHSHVMMNGNTGDTFERVCCDCDGTEYWAERYGYQFLTVS